MSTQSQNLRPIGGRDLIAAGLQPGPLFKPAMKAARRADAQLGRTQTLDLLAQVVAQPIEHRDNPQFGELASAILDEIEAEQNRELQKFVERETPAPYQSWCEDADSQALDQMSNAMRLPSTVCGALMPDAHVGYGLPIGGVLATEGTVVPYAVGVDIACRMKISILDIDPAALENDGDRFDKALLQCTAFGKGGEFQSGDRSDHSVLDKERWQQDKFLSRLRDKAWKQLGSSGSGNHFVEFGALTIDKRSDDLGLDPGSYVAVMSHSGSRGPGAMIAGHFTKIAKALHPDLPHELHHLAWLDLDSDDGRDYWYAMNLMGMFASACHEVIHDKIARHLNSSVLAAVENHHNFAWLEEHNGRELVVHRKGATPAGTSVLGVIPGSMSDPAFIVRGKGSAASLNSASHGAGRVMSRTEAKNRYTWKQVKPRLQEAGVRVLAAGIDENPYVYKNILEVMKLQQDLVEPIARFDPKVVRMADAGEIPED